MNFIYAISSSIFVSLISFVGAISLLFREDLLKKVLLLLVGFSAGSLIGGAFLHLLPEGLENINDYNTTFLITIFGIVLFFLMEKFLFWRHCHKGGRCDVHTFTYMNLIGDGVHNFIDGLIIGSAFYVDVKLGAATVFAIIFHEIPQELGDFGVLIYGGMNKAKALFLNFVSAATAIIGTILGFFFSSQAAGFTSFLMPFAAGGFIYIASSDLIPELHRQSDTKKSIFSILFFIIGICFMYVLKIYGSE
ncbi:MAG: ZIP family metal transporter [Candidatus Goldbacteria bacterium]|nr:ZIP family metal transporter [Candidatus Goldiibacteriota bacterium]